MTPSAADFSFARGDAEISFWIHVTPRAARQAVGRVRGDALRVAVNAAPSEGAANAACVALLAKKLGVARGVELPPRSKNRRKRVRVGGDPDVLATRLMELAAEKGTEYPGVLQ